MRGLESTHPGALALLAAARRDRDEWERACRLLVSAYLDPEGDFDGALTAAADLIAASDGEG